MTLLYCHPFEIQLYGPEKHFIPFKNYKFHLFFRLISPGWVSKRQTLLRDSLFMHTGGTEFKLTNPFQCIWNDKVKINHLKSNFKTRLGMYRDIKVTTINSPTFRVLSRNLWKLL